MKLVYLADSHIPSRATNGMQVMCMCAAFAENGADVTLLHPHRFGNRPEGYKGDLWSFYGLPPIFRTITYPTPLTLGLSRHRRLARAARFGPLWTLLFWRSRPTAAPFVVYSRSMLGAWAALNARSFYGRRSACLGVIVELHDAPRAQYAREIVRRAHGVVTISHALRDRVLAEIPDVERRVVVEHDGVALDRFANLDLDRNEARRHLLLDEETMVVGYTGRINSDKGIPTVLEAARRLQEEGVTFLLVGKWYEGLDRVAGELPSVTLMGFVPPADVPRYVAATDVLVMPTSARIAYADFTSPLKLFEYMASRRPLIASDLPVLHEVLTHERNALLFRPDDADSLCEMIGRLRREPELAASLAEQAATDVVEYSWERRAHRLLESIEDLVPYARSR
jgi:glycosyltransferase involved in cell wall biosynthesis